MRNARINELQDGIKISRRKTSTTSDMQMIPPPMAESKEKLKNLLMRVKEESEKASLKLDVKKPISWHPVSSLHGK